MFARRTFQIASVIGLANYNNKAERWWRTRASMIGLFIYNKAERCGGRMENKKSTHVRTYTSVIGPA
jgi:hypothetical protein